ncbi:MAG: hypothetical protein ACOH2N_00160 [Devosia sp.]
MLANTAVCGNATAFLDQMAERGDGAHAGKMALHIDEINRRLVRFRPAASILPALFLDAILNE